MRRSPTWSRTPSTTRRSVRRWRWWPSSARTELSSACARPLPTDCSRTSRSNGSWSAARSPSPRSRCLSRRSRSSSGATWARTRPAVGLGYLGLGSNVGDRRANLEAAVAALERHGVRVLASSSTYDTDPVGEILDQPDFLNACLRIETDLDAEGLLDACKTVERKLGREARGPRHAPRPIDVDLLLLDGVQLSTERLRVPHAEVTSRRFVLVPLVELDPQLATPDGRRPAAPPGGVARDPAGRPSGAPP